MILNKSIGHTGMKRILIAVSIFIAMVVMSCVSPDAKYRKHQIHIHVNEAAQYCWYCEEDIRFKRTHG